MNWLNNHQNNSAHTKRLYCECQRCYVPGPRWREKYWQNNVFIIVDVAEWFLKCLFPCICIIYSIAHAIILCSPMLRSRPIASQTLPHYFVDYHTLSTMQQTLLDWIINMAYKFAIDQFASFWYVDIKFLRTKASNAESVSKFSSQHSSTLLNIYHLN